ncbi:GIY-YIG nuclease family protein [Arenibaculum pallidiluteum]|uniref:GIY-YIG nuclease family protein n=1 Tax=Arenibaculum pallidiluteum TaxID=2812559 RepID=UPI001A95EA91|nr:GIY-YIG nuclease family protein [Arenibaculum pallidiluteum]
MMTGDGRKAAVAAYKERKSAIGIYAIRCAASGAAWVGPAQNLDTVRNRIWFALRHGGCPHRDLQQAWRDHGSDALSFEILERLPEQESSYLRTALLKERAAHWRAALGARPV